jgi:hypothetical protein
MAGLFYCRLYPHFKAKQMVDIPEKRLEIGCWALGNAAEMRLAPPSIGALPLPMQELSSKSFTPLLLIPDLMEH